MVFTFSEPDTDNLAVSLGLRRWQALSTPTKRVFGVRVALRDRAACASESALPALTSSAKHWAGDESQTKVRARTVILCIDLPPESVRQSLTSLYHFASGRACLVFLSALAGRI